MRQSTWMHRIKGAIHHQLEIIQQRCRPQTMHRWGRVWQNTQQWQRRARTRISPPAAQLIGGGMQEISQAWIEMLRGWKVR
jgi:hypothetical protein